VHQLRGHRRIGPGERAVRLTIPPLRERVDEIEPLARAFAKRAAEASDRTTTPVLGAQVVAVLRGYAWPGNIRELRNVIERAVLLAAEDVITLEHLPLDRLVRTLAPPPAVVSAPAPPLASTMRAPAEQPQAPLAPLGRRVTARDPDERARIEEALARCGGNQSKAAQLLGVSRRTLVSRIVEYGIRRPRDED
jgi:DNA-binding NtrC family response regulator